jgi:AraC-like DNA-binding protein
MYTSTSLYELHTAGYGRQTVHFITVIFITANGVFESNGKKIDCTPGNTILIHAPGYYTITPEEEHERAAQILDISASCIDDLFISQIADCPIFYDFIRLSTGNDAAQFLYFDSDRQSPVYWCAKILWYHASLTTERDLKAVRNALMLFLTTLHRVHQQNLVITESTMMPQYDAGKFLKYMADNYSTVTLESAAAHFGFNQTYFSILFKKKASVTFSQKMQEIKMEQAKRLLTTTNLTIEEIAVLTGFSEKSYFHRNFKRITGMTPHQYRVKKELLSLIT